MKNKQQQQKLEQAQIKYFSQLSSSIMKSQEMFLSSLLDFSNIASKRATDYPHNHGTSHNNHATSLNQHINQSLIQQNRKTPIQNMGDQLLKQSEVQLLGANNEKLLKAFNGLRDKLSVMSRENTLLKQSLSASEQQTAEQKQRQSCHLSQIGQLSKKLSYTEQELTQYKMRLNGLKQSMQESQSRTQQLERSRINIQHLLEQNKRLKEQIQVSMQLSIQQKLQLEQEIQQLRLKDIQETHSNQQAQNQLCKKNSDLIRLQNQYKKLKLLYDEQIFMKNINSESIILQKENQSLKLIAEELQSKLKKQKNKKYELQTKLLELQEKVRLYGTKTDIYEGELSTIVKKIHKVQKDNLKAQNQANSALNQKLSWQEKFYQSSIILEELINRVKRQILGDAVQLAKTCEFRLNKLKNGQILDFPKRTPSIHGKRTKSSSKKIRAQSSNRKIEHQPNSSDKLNLQLKKLVSFSNSHSNDFKLSNQESDGPRTVLKQKATQNAIINENNNLSDVKRKLFNEQTTVSKMGINHEFSKQKERYLFHPNQQKSSFNQPISQLNLQTKIRKQRELMEKKLRQKILYHKIEDATSSPVKNKLRQQYLNMNGLDLN